MRARACEVRVARELEARGWKILFHDVRVWRTQVDLIGRSPSGVLVLVEVKSDSAGRAYLSHSQKARLLRAAQLLAGYEPVELLLALVAGSAVEFVPVDGWS